jgi:predicted solute-binding protein
VPGKKRLGASPHLYCEPVIVRLKADDGFELTVDAQTRNAIKLRQHDLDAAFLSPIDYARESSEYTIVPGVAVSSDKATQSVVLHFREGIRSVRTMAVDPSSTSEIILAKILLEEQFDTAPTIIPAHGPLQVMLQRADSALLVGDPSLQEAGGNQNRIDLIEAWNDLTELPYVHGFWCAREEDLTRVQARKLQEALQQGVTMFDEIARSGGGQHLLHESPEFIKTYLESFSFELADEAEEGLREFIRYAYYHGVLPDIADLNYYSFDSGDSDSDAAISLN